MTNTNRRSSLGGRIQQIATAPFDFMSSVVSALCTSLQLSLLHQASFSVLCPVFVLQFYSGPNRFQMYILYCVTPIHHLRHLSSFLHSSYFHFLCLLLLTSPYSCVLSFWCPIYGIFRLWTRIPCIYRGCCILLQHSFHLGEFCFCN